MAEIKHNRYNTGVFGYGQEGPIGETGPSGNSIYYSAITNPVEIKDAILNNRELSNNPDRSARRIEYKDGDIILTHDMSMYMIVSTERRLDIDYAGEFIGNDNAVQINVEFEPLNISSEVPNPYYVSHNLSTEGRPYMREYAEDFVHGCTLGFRLKIEPEPANFVSVKAYVRSNNGLKIAETMMDTESVKNGDVCKIFIDSKWYGISEDSNTLFGVDSSVPDDEIYKKKFTMAAKNYILNNTTLVVECTLTDGSIRRCVKKFNL